MNASTDKPRDKSKKGTPKARPKLPPKVVAQAKALAQQSGIPLKHALQVVQGEQTLAQVLNTLRFQEQVEQLCRRNLLVTHHRKLVLEGAWPLDKALFESRLRRRKWESDYSNSHLDQFQPLPVELSVALVGKRLLAGQLVVAEPFRIKLQLPDGQELDIPKHDIKFFFLSEERKQTLKQLKWGPPEAGVELEHLRKIGLRVNVQAARYLQAMEEGRNINWTSVEGDELRGRVTWLGRYEVALQLAKGQTVYLMRHAVKSLQ